MLSLKVYCRNILILFTLPSIVLAGCQASATMQAPDQTAVFESALLTATYAVPTNALSQTATVPPPTQTPIPTATVARTPPNLPGTYQTNYLNSLDVPHSYITETCEYLQKRWNPNNSSPGTIVMPIMFHSITDGVATQDYQISHDTLVNLVRDLRQQGFEAISMKQLEGFLYTNEKIPVRSVILIVDDRHYADYYNTHFREFYEDFGWTVTNAWISHPDVLQVVVDGNVALQNEGWVIHQAHGVVHNLPIMDWPDTQYLSTDLFGDVSADEYIHNEIEGSMRRIEEIYGSKPLAYIWPGGGFSTKAVGVARDAGFTLGFTVNPRGPIMFNWIPLADQKDPARPSYLPEGETGDPLLVLPRFWDQDGSWQIDGVREIGNQAAEEARVNKEIELEYYQIVCEPTLGPIPTLIP